MKVLTLASLFPGSAAPRHGIFVKERMVDFVRRTGAEVRVVSPVPYFPRWIRSTTYGHFSRAPRREEWAGFSIEHPRYLMVPKAGVRLQGLSYFVGVRGTVRRVQREFPFDVLDVHYAYPDGFAGALLKHRLRVPMVLTVRGTDVNLLPELKATRDQVRYALERADRVVAVSNALAELAVKAGADPRRVVTLRNGVDSDRFTPRDRTESRAKLGLPEHGRVLVSVGFLVERKGHDLVLRAVARMPAGKRPFVAIAGDGPELPRLEALIAELGLVGSARLLGAVEHDELPWVYSAADLSVLASSREGWPNVLLESMACGTPVVATSVHGSPEVVAEDGVGRLVPERTVEALERAILDAFEAGLDRGHVRRYAERMSWKETSEGLADVFRGVLREAGHRTPAVGAAP